MIEESVVQVVRDSGHKNRWGIGQYLYRQDGKKLTVQGKWVLSMTAGFFLLSTMLVLIKGPTQMELRSPIAFEGTVSNTSSVEVPVAAHQDAKSRQARLRGSITTVRRFTGLEVIRRNTALQIPPGSIGKARLVSGGSNGIVKASLIETLSLNGEVLVESGSVLVGNGSSTDDRLLIDFGKMVLKDGSVQTVRAQACDVSDQMVGIKGSQVSKYGTQLAAGIGLNFAGGLAAGLQETTVQNGIATRKTDLRNAALNGAATASVEQSKEILEKWKQQKSVIQVKSGTEICLIFSGD